MARHKSWGRRLPAISPTLSEQQLNRLDESGIIMSALKSSQGDTLVGKVSRQKVRQRSPRKKTAAGNLRRKKSQRWKDHFALAKASAIAIDAGFHREGIVRDKRAQQIIDDELKTFPPLT
jgi:DNA-directed RNA polymerase subunit beta